MIKADFHTHSSASPDGGLSIDDYQQLLERGMLDCIAITDHNRIDRALECQQALGEAIIVGEEINTADGEVIGLFLSKAVEPHQSLAAAIEAIHAQGGLVYLPHPFETVRRGVSEAALTGLADAIDIVEVANGRTLQNRGRRAASWASAHHKPGAASSDAHGRAGIGRTYTQLPEVPTAETLPKLLRGARPIYRRPPWHAYAQPRFNRLRKRLSRS